MGNKTFDQNQNLLDLFNDNMYFIDTLTSKYRSYPNYESSPLRSLLFVKLI